MGILQRIRRSREKRKPFVHIVSGAVILIHTYEKWESGHDTWLYFLPAGLVFLTVAILHPVIERRAPWIDGIFFVIEGVLSLIVAADFFHVGKKALPWCYVALAGFQFFVAFRRSRKGIAHHRSLHTTPPEQSTANPDRGRAELK